MKTAMTGDGRVSSTPLLQVMKHTGECIHEPVHDITEGCLFRVLAVDQTLCPPR